MTEKKKSDSSGIVLIEKNKVTWQYKDEVLTTFDLSEVVVIGEYTNSDGPWFDDWFIVFVLKNGNWVSISWYVDNVDDLTEVLCDKFQDDLDQTCLANSTNWKSVVSFPQHLKDKPLFELTTTENYKEPKNSFERFIHGLGLGKFNTTKYIKLTEEVKRELNLDNQHLY